jgi:signal transduction histidine kinase
MQSEVPDSKRVFQTAAWMWLVYLVSLAVIDLFIYANKPIDPILWYHLINGIPAILFLGLSRSKWLKNQVNIVAPIMVLLITIAPILVNEMFDIRLPQAPLSNLEGMVLRQLPVLMIGLVLVAWHYKLVTMVIYTVALNLFELSIVLLQNRLDDPRLLSSYFIIVIRTVCFLVVGIFVNQLINHLRSQQESLRSANQQLSHYASTLENLTTSRERNRMSRELHDTVIHTLSGLTVQLETTKAYLTVNPETARNLLDQSLESTRYGLQETRRALKDLRASPLEDLGLIKALQQLTKTAAERGKLSLEVFLPKQELFLSPDVEQCIYRIAQEAVENVVHHANARKLMVRLDIKEKDIDLLIQDDGIGFNPETHILSGHFGLSGMRERAQMSGGELTVTSKPNCGTTIRLVIKGCVE